MCASKKPPPNDDPPADGDAPEGPKGTRFGHGVFERAKRGAKKEPRRNAPLHARDKLGKYRIVRRIGGGGFSRVYEAVDKIEGTHVALKVPRAEFVTEANLEQFRREVRTHAALDHPSILPIKNADLIGDVFVIAVPLGKGSLATRMRRRMSLETFLTYARQMLDAVAHAHRHRIVHCDVKPENFLLFEGDRVRLADFGIAKIAQRTLKGSGSGTLGYIAPEQAMGKPSFRGDVFSLGLILWQMLSGELPEYPFAWPLPGLARMRRKVPPDFVVFLRRALQVDPKKRFADAGRMLAAFDKLEAQARRFARGRRTRRTGSGTKSATRDWRQVRFRQFQKQHRTDLALDRVCRHCGGPMSEAMHCCPWCGKHAEPKRHDTRFPRRCERCQRGRKLDWRYCAWCHGKGFTEVSERRYPDARYSGTCDGCKEPLLPFARYCTWCRRKVARKWRIEGVKDTCSRCGWGVTREFWSHCPWCGHAIRHGR